ncbi:TPA: ABC transporter permease [Escherichia coli]|nr:ABC transporter permease [Escherichia coli]
MNLFFSIFNYNFIKQIKSTAFKAVTIILCLLILGIFGLTKVINQDEKPVNILVVDNTGYFKNVEEWNSDLSSSHIALSDKSYSVDECKREVLNNDNLVIITFDERSNDNIQLTVYDNNDIDYHDLHAIQSYADNIYKYEYGKSIGMTDEHLSHMSQSFSCDVIQVDTSFEDTYLLSYCLLLLLVLAIMMYGSQVAGEITYAKTNRVMELLLTSASPYSIFIGTTLAIGLAGLLQLAIILSVGVFSYKIINPQILFIDGLQIDFSMLSFDKLMVYVAFFILSYLIYAVLNGGIGSLVSKNEDIMVAVLPVTLISCVQMFTGLIAISSPNSVLCNVFSYIPFTSAGTMVMRYFMEDVSLSSVIISMLILVASIIVVSYFSINLFINGVVYYGNFKLKTLLKFWRKNYD